MGALNDGESSFEVGNLLTLLENSRHGLSKVGLQIADPASKRQGQTGDPHDFERSQRATAFDNGPLFLDFSFQSGGVQARLVVTHSLAPSSLAGTESVGGSSASATPSGVEGNRPGGAA